MKSILKFILKSSADPRKTSLTVKGMLLSIVPIAMDGFGMVCTLGAACYDFQASDFETIIGAISQLVYYGLSLVATLQIIYGAARKLYRTFTGTNFAIDW